ncbi:MAG: hypothetical protein HC822_17070 [Oscillochloris sp.]|nr:hypothetical protein [Oscillochloris sp.]
MNSTPFSLGLTYWPRPRRPESPLPAWANVDHGALRADCEYLAEVGCTTLRFDLRWAEVQPGAAQINTATLRGLERALTLADDFKLRVVVGLLAASTAGVFHLPDWAVGLRLPLGKRPAPLVIPDRAPLVLAGDRYRRQPLRDLYADPELRAAIDMLLRELIGAFAQHPAIEAWLPAMDLPQLLPFANQRAAADWYVALAERARALGARRLIAQLRPADLARLNGPRPEALHHAGYDLLLDVAPLGPIKADVAPLVQVYALLAGLLQAEARKPVPVLLGGLGMATAVEGRAGWVTSERFGESTQVLLADPEQQATLVEAALGALYRVGAAGVWLAGYCDPAPGLWNVPPLDRSVAPRSWGIVDYSGREKPAAAAVRAFGAQLRAGSLPTPGAPPALPIDPERYWRDPQSVMRELLERDEDQ